MIDNFEHVYAVILAGGGGTRLWPKSRENTPKQFLRLTEKNTMMQVAANRLTKVIDWDHIIVITNQKYLSEVKQQLPQVPESNIIAEPAKRDTALAMLVGALYAYSKDPDAIVVNGASDHVVTDTKEFSRVMRAAIAAATDKTQLVTVGIRPTFPSSAFGYIKIGEEIGKLDKGLPLFRVANFTEKPNVAAAQAFIATGKYFWNANMYVWSAEALLTAFQKYMPEMYEKTLPLHEAKTDAFHKELPAIYESSEAISIDYAISEKAENLVLIPGDFGWNDVGDWRVVYDLSPKDKNENVIIGENEDSKVVAINATHNLVHTDGRLIALVGLKDMIVIDTPEILMIVPKEKSQDVKKVVEHLKANDQTEYL